MRTVNEIYQQTLDLLRTDGWCQGRPMDDQGRRCLMRALSDALAPAYPTEDSRAYYMLFNSCNGVASWNDTPGRTFAEVEAKLLELIDS